MSRSEWKRLVLAALVRCDEWLGWMRPRTPGSSIMGSTYLSHSTVVISAAPYCTLITREHERDLQKQAIFGHGLQNQAIFRTFARSSYFMIIFSDAQTTTSCDALQYLKINEQYYVIITVLLSVVTYQFLSILNTLITSQCCRLGLFFIP